MNVNINAPVAINSTAAINGSLNFSINIIPSKPPIMPIAIAVRILSIPISIGVPNPSAMDTIIPIIAKIKGNFVTSSFLSFLDCIVLISFFDSSCLLSVG